MLRECLQPPDEQGCDCQHGNGVDYIDGLHAPHYHAAMLQKVALATRISGALPEKNLQKTVEINLSAGLHAWLKARASEDGLTLTAYCRRLLAIHKRETENP